MKSKVRRDLSEGVSAGPIGDRDCLVSVGFRLFDLGQIASRKMPLWHPGAGTGIVDFIQKEFSTRIACPKAIAPSGWIRSSLAVNN